MAYGVYGGFGGGYAPYGGKGVISGGAKSAVISSRISEGTKAGYDLELISRVSNAVTVPVIAFGGVGKWQDFVDGINIGKADAVSAAIRACSPIAAISLVGSLNTGSIKFCAYLGAHG